MAGSRRQFIQAVAGTAAGLALPTLAPAADLPQLTWATFTPGFVPAFMECTLANGFDRKHGVALAPPIPYSSLTTYYGDFVAGSFDMCFGSWDTFAVRAFAGVPVKYLCGINPGNLLNIVTASDSIQSITDLRGKTLAAPTSSGTFRLMKSLVRAFYGIDLEKETTIQTVDHPLGGVTLVLADRADAAMTWEPSVTIGMTKNPKLRVLLNMGEAYEKHEGAVMPFLGLAIRQAALDKYPGIAERLYKVFADGAAAMQADPQAAYAAAEKETKLPASTLVTATQNGRLKYRFESMADPKARQAVIRSSEILVAEKDLPKPVDASFFVG
ncbi:twin-arginine translocation pathway signal protein [Bradyrhizobium sp. WBOS7]|uniref:Twin-arginine translocation pathway signal protein n=1 Tax=Bradyrhizobium betae TaxID=244734 RepID=A0AAE9NGF1_9BRAD|nr:MULTISPECIES: ABC transporter substrate-binding protein [Bradyrhizobium]MDD1573427.1 twin-arginine translocation pathway signal protein [Bradyrhizobium sp. WBOS1]UUO38415.1 twin-arginine translocation pathway signal protein [Bradyrhizobium sp. WBOS01]MDD1530402.1 twin-arginine translocation pathway signal protein [Bradyrhizobium sp. WBOS2]MDD1579562.1 twin-arginine translocation pathway signal protein [Bradyrhizobium sp. WBOS7]MDD1603037.1 twin-arginine translocation pathway signal protein 